MTSERLNPYDTTPRDGQQTQGVFTAQDTSRIVQPLDTLGIDCGWPGASPTDSPTDSAAFVTEPA